MSANGGIKRHIPNVITLVNLCCGFLAIHFISISDWTSVVILLVIAGIADLLDGLVARALGVSSPIGVQLDSLADMVSFGLVPGLILSKVYLDLKFDSITELLSQELSSIILIALPGLLIVCAAALRLAKFNTLESTDGDFTGLATPSTAALIAGFILIMTNLSNIPLWIIGISIFAARLMVSDYTFFSLKFKGMNWKGNELRFLFILLAVALFILLKEKALFVVMLAYILVNTVLHLYKKISS